MADAFDNTHSGFAPHQAESKDHRWRLEFPRLGLGIISTFILVIAVFAVLNAVLFTRDYYPGYAIVLTVVQEALFLAFLLKFGGVASAIKEKIKSFF